MEKLRSKPLAPHWRVFLLALGLSAIMFLPFLIYDKGYFFFFGDFNVQQIPFYQLAHEAVRSGDIFWNWYTDLGANFIASYSFYLLFSPFFWLTLPFPTSFVPYLMAPLLMLKTACAALTSYLYISRFLRKKEYAAIASLLYAFSGFAVYNIFFNHFHEALVFFPLMLIGLEELMVNNRRGLFAITVAINCLVNYWFFIGEVMFVILYVFVRMTSPDWKMTLPRFFWIAFESVVGLACAMFLFLPSVLAIMGNPRTTSDNLLSGWNFWLYWDTQRFPAILQSIFFPPDLPSRPNFFPDQGAKWSSMTAWLPLFSTAGVISYLFWAKKSWVKKMLWICLALALMPGPNSLFILFNHSYYARWFYMPILLMCLATAVALERADVDLMRGWRWTLGIILFFTVMVGFTPVKEDGEWYLGLMAEPARFWLTVALAALCLVLTYWLLQFHRGRGSFARLSLCMVSVISVLHGMIFITNGKLHSDDTQWIREVALYGREHLELPQDTFARSDIYKSMDNLGMYWHIPNIQAFHSVVPNSIMEFYPEVGVKRDVSSKPETSNYALRNLLSVRWFMAPEGRVDNMDEIMPGYSYYDTQLGYDIYENDYFLPMGFAYDTVFDKEMMDTVPTSLRSNMMLISLYLEDTDAIARNQDILTLVEELPTDQFGEDGMMAAVEERRTMTCDTFTIDNRGFTATSNLDEERLMFFSVPYDEGWSATVNGQPVVIEKANIGFMAVRVPAGEATIRFTYLAPGLIPGLIVSAGGLAILIFYLIWARKYQTVGNVTLSLTEENPYVDWPQPNSQTQADPAITGNLTLEQLTALADLEEEQQDTGPDPEPTQDDKKEEP